MKLFVCHVATNTVSMLSFIISGELLDGKPAHSFEEQFHIFSLLGQSEETHN
jgi:hypothetical protein